MQKSSEKINHWLRNSTREKKRSSHEDGLTLLTETLAQVAFASSKHTFLFN